MLKTYLFIFMVTIVLFLSTQSYSTTWYVRQDGSGDFTSIRTAVGHAQSGDTVLVGSGHYYERTVIIYMKSVHLMSEEGPEVTTVELYQYPYCDDVKVIHIEDAPDSCSVIGFTITGAAGGILFSGGGICNLRSKTLIKNNIITENWIYHGGGIYISGYPSPTIEYNVICDNRATTSGAMGIHDSSPIIRFNTIVNNLANPGGGGISIGWDSSYPTITHNIIANNSGPTGGGIVCGSYCPPENLTIECNDVWNNAPANYYGLPDQTGINGNISEDPLFCGIEGSGNFYLQVNSPCSEENAPVYCGDLRIGCYPVNCIVEIKHEPWSNIKSLFRKERER